MTRLATTLIGGALAAAFLAGPAAGQEPHRVAFFAASSQNGFNQAVYEGIQRRAEELGNVETAIFDGEFDAALQYSQIEDAIASDQFDAFVVLPNDTVGIAPVIQEATEAGYPVASVLFPIGPDLTTLEPQVPGLTATVSSPPADGARWQAEDVVRHCQGIDPCRVVVIIGQKIYPFDNLRYETYLEVLGQHPNIEVVATVEGNYDPDQSLTGMQDALQANPEIDVVLSNADQHLFGAEIAIADAGLDVADLYLSGGGASQIAIDAIREGRWDATLAFFPRSMGERGLQAVVDALEGREVDATVNMDEEGPIKALITREVLDANPDFQGEWQG